MHIMSTNNRVRRPAHQDRAAAAATSGLHVTAPFAIVGSLRLELTLHTADFDLSLGECVVHLRDGFTVTGVFMSTVSMRWRTQQYWRTFRKNTA